MSSSSQHSCENVCAVDWAQALQWFQVVSEFWLWPSVVLIIFFLVFRRYGADLVARVTEVYGVKLAPSVRSQVSSPPEVSASPLSSGEGKNAGGNEASEKPEFNFAKNFIIKNFKIDESRLDDQGRTLLSLSANAFVVARFEWINGLILGSQLTLLRQLAAQSLSVEQARAIWEEGKKRREIVDYDFEPWLKWTQSAAQLVEESEEMVSISETGRSFLNWLVQNGRPLDRGGWAPRPAGTKR